MRRSSFFLVSLAAALVACGSSSNPPPDNGNSDSGPGGNDAGNDATVTGDAGDSGSVTVDASDGGAFLAAAHPALPVLFDNGGPVLHTPKIVTVTFPGDPDVATYEGFGAVATSSAWWDAARAGYCEQGSTTNCVGKSTAPGTAVRLTAAPAATYSDSQDPAGTSTLKPFIASLIPGKIPQPDAQTLLTFYFPASTVITLNPDTAPAQSCVGGGFGGYHNSMTVGGVQFAYAIVIECPPSTVQKLPTVQETTLAASHEMIEAATDPFVTANTNGFYLNFADPNVLPWNASGGGECGDLCVDQLGLGQDEATEGTYTVQRIWSNPAVLAGKDPCVPGIAAPYLNVAPDQWLVTATPGGPEVKITGTAFSDKPTAAWTFRGIDLNAAQLPDGGIDRNPYVTITVNGVPKTTVNNGDRVSIGVTLHKDPGPLSNSVGGAMVWLLSSDGATVGASKIAHFWPVLVTSPADAKDGGLDTVDAAQDMPRRMPSLTDEQRRNLMDAIRSGEL